MVNAMKIVSKTEEKIFQMIGVTFMQFFNTAVILFLVSFDIFNLRIHTNWYATHAGTIVSAMIFTAIWPIIEVLVFGGIFKMLRYHDHGWTNDKFNTNLPSV